MPKNEKNNDKSKELDSAIVSEKTPFWCPDHQKWEKEVHRPNVTGTDQKEYKMDVKKSSVENLGRIMLKQNSIEKVDFGRLFGRKKEEPAREPMAANRNSPAHNNWFQRYLLAHPDWKEGDPLPHNAWDFEKPDYVPNYGDPNWRENASAGRGQGPGPSQTEGGGAIPMDDSGRSQARPMPAQGEMNQPSINNPQRNKGVGRVEDTTKSVIKSMSRAFRLEDDGPFLVKRSPDEDGIDPETQAKIDAADQFGYTGRGRRISEGQRQRRQGQPAREAGEEAGRDMTSGSESIIHRDPHTGSMFNVEDIKAMHDSDKRGFVQSPLFQGLSSEIKEHLGYPIGHKLNPEQGPDPIEHSLLKLMKEEFNPYKLRERSSFTQEELEELERDDTGMTGKKKANYPQHPDAGTGTVQDIIGHQQEEGARQRNKPVQASLLKLRKLQVDSKGGVNMHNTGMSRKNAMQHNRDVNRDDRMNMEKNRVPMANTGPNMRTGTFPFNAFGTGGGRRVPTPAQGTGPQQNMAEQHETGREVGDQQQEGTARMSSWDIANLAAQGVAGKSPQQQRAIQDVQDKKQGLKDYKRSDEFAEGAAAAARLIPKAGQSSGKVAPKVERKVEGPPVPNPFND